MGQYSAYVKRVKEAHLTCEVCGEEYIGPEPEICCDGTDCGCRGEPISPAVCSLECAKKHDDNGDITDLFTPKQTTDDTE